jgi:beta-phosphoglucomutase
MPRFVFWDCDNTLVSNGQIHWEKHVNVLARHGITLEPKYHQSFYHNNGEQNWQLLVKDYGFNVPCDVYLKEVDAWYHARIAQAPLRDGVGEALARFHQNGAHQCVVTNARTASVRPMLEAKNLMPYFEFVLCKEDYTERKPHPMPYLTAFDKMQATHGPIVKSECLAIEDDPLGVRSAHDAGLPVLHRRRFEHELPEPVAAASLYTGDDLLKFLFQD